MVNHAVFLDRDGTINRDTGFVHTMDAFELLPGALAALQRLTQHDIRIVIVTNQSGVARGLYTEADLHAFHQHMLAMLTSAGVRITDMYYCPHHPAASVQEYRRVCACRKPGIELLTQAMQTYALTQEHTVMIGDRTCDIDAGRAVGIPTYLVETGCGARDKYTTNASFVVPDLSAAVDHALSAWGVVAAPALSQNIS